METASPESILDSVNINIRNRNYKKVITYCLEFLNDYADSTQSAGLISKLYLSELNSDSSENRLSDLKTLLENLILNHSENEALIKQAFYFIQKCKVSLEEYESAMNGFQQIMDQNPYSYEALVSSWDYSATSLLLEGGGGSGGAISNFKLQISKDESKEDERENSDKVKSQIRNSKSQILSDDPYEKYDTKAFTKEDRKAIRVNVYHSFETNREKEINIVKTLEKKISEGKADITEKKELEMKKVLNEIAKPRKPLNISEHLSNVNKDINRITETGRSNSLSKNQISIPVEYMLSQNYPNPFNPSTHLDFGISKLGFVSLKVYDILGREVKTLKNEIKPAGRFKVEFDGSNFSSGVYFYRIEAGDFVQTKRMVFIK
jgi:tetratricopeptide (TPR) repeat protein